MHLAASYRWQLDYVPQRGARSHVRTLRVQLCFWCRRRAEVLGSASSVCVFEWTKWRRSPRLTKVSGLSLPTRDLDSQPAAALSLGLRRLRVASLVWAEFARRGLLGSSAQAAARVMASSRTPGPALCSALDVGVSEFSCSDPRASLGRLAPEDFGGRERRGFRGRLSLSPLGRCRWQFAPGKP